MVSSQGHILTTSHLCISYEPNSKELRPENIYVCLADPNTKKNIMMKATVIVFETNTDVVLIKLEKDNTPNLPINKIDSDVNNIKVMLVSGESRGYLNLTGIVSVPSFIDTTGSKQLPSILTTINTDSVTSGHDIFCVPFINSNGKCIGMNIPSY